MYVYNKIARSLDVGGEIQSNFIIDVFLISKGSILEG